MDPEVYHPKLLPSAIDEIAAAEPESLYGKCPIDPSDYGAGFRSISYSQLANAINGVAHWLEAEAGRGDPEQQQTPAIAYLGPNDFRYVFAFVGAMKAGYKLFLPSPRNSLVAQLSLLEALNCSKLVVAEPAHPIVAEILEKRKMQRLEIKGMDYFLEHAFEPCEFTVTTDQAARAGAFVCHTSGTTGIPKPCIYTHEFVLRVARTFHLTPPSGYTSLQSQLGHNSHILLLPLFHPAGVQLGILNAIYNRCVVILPSWTTPPSIEGLLAMLGQIEADWAMLSPFTLETLAKDAAMLATVASRLKMIVFSGGSLPKPLGDVIAREIRLASFLGSSETAGVPIIYPRGLDFATDWDYMSFHPEIGAALEPRDEGTFELVLKRSPSAEPYQPVFDRFPELESFATGDLFKPHPTRQDMWTHASRADEIIVFLNGEKTNPVSFESHLTKHPDVEGALVFGDQRFEAGLVIELKERSPLSAEMKMAWTMKLWPTIEEANRDAPAHARVARSHILFTEAEKPFLRTPKGTVMRKATLSLYSKEIGGLYHTVEEASGQDLSSSNVFVVSDDQEALLEIIRESCRESLALVDVEDNSHLLTSGVDSLQVLRLCRNLKSKLSLPRVDDLKPATIYQNPSPMHLARALQRMASRQNDPTAEDDGDHERRTRLETTLNFFKRRIDDLADARLGPESKGKGEGKGRIQSGEEDMSDHRHVCLITGTTGSIGSYILRSLMHNEGIGKIYCLNRRSPMNPTRTRQINHNRETDPHLPTEFPAEKVVFLEGDVSSGGKFALDEEVYENLHSSVTLIIHNAWAVDFNLPLSSFMQHLEGVVNLCEFAFSSSVSLNGSQCPQRQRQRQRPTLMFISSVSAVMNHALSSPSSTPSGQGQAVAVPEVILPLSDAEDPEGDSNSNNASRKPMSMKMPPPPASGGYAESKYLAELILAHASSALDIPVLVARVGQVCGALRSPGRWNPKEWIPRLISGSMHLCAVPDSLGRYSYHDSDVRDVDWIPVDVLADAVVEILLGESAGKGATVEDDHDIKRGGEKRTRVYHLVNTKRATWASMVPTIINTLNVMKCPQPRGGEGVESPVVAVSTEEWLRRLHVATEQLASTDDSNPAARLIDFYEQKFSDELSPLWETGNTVAASLSLQQLGSISPEDLEKWIKMWF